MNPEEKDALINVPNAGLTLAEEMGMANKEDRAYFNPGSGYDSSHLRAKDMPFARMEQYFNLQKPPKIKFEDLKSVVTTHVFYNDLPYDSRIDYIKLSPERVLVPITIELNNRDLEFKKQMNFNQATVNVYGVVTSLTGRTMWEFEDIISVEYLDEYFEHGKNKRSEYQHIVGLPPGQRYKLSLVLKDVNSKSCGNKRGRIDRAQIRGRRAANQFDNSCQRHYIGSYQFGSVRAIRNRGYEDSSRCEIRVSAGPEFAYLYADL